MLIFGLSGCSMVESILPKTASRDAETEEVTESGKEDVFAIRVGDCYQEEGSSEIADVPVVPCGEPHDYEVYHSFKMPDGEWPTDDVMAKSR